MVATRHTAGLQEGKKHQTLLSIGSLRRMRVERKYDGEYYQIHIDLYMRRAPIQVEQVPR